MISRLLPTTLDPFQPDLAAIHPSLRLRISTRAKRLALRLDAKSGHVFLVMPKRASFKKALDFARQYSDWIDKHATGIPDIIPLTHGTVIPVLGVDRIIQVTMDESLKRTTITMTGTTIAVHTNKDDPSSRITRFLKTLAKDEITRIALEKAGRINRVPTTIQVRDTKSRWGSCSSDGTLSLSWRLILAPPAALDYVIAHEVAHMVHMNHKTRFWALCEKLSADFKSGHGWMKTHGHTLMRYG